MLPFYNILANNSTILHFIQKKADEFFIRFLIFALTSAKIKKRTAYTVR